MTKNTKTSTSLSSTRSRVKLSINILLALLIGGPPDHAKKVEESEEICGKC